MNKISISILLRFATLTIMLAMSGQNANAHGLDPRWGLQWGQNIGEVQAQVQGWRFMQKVGEEERYAATALPLRHPSFSVYMLVFKHGGLSEVLAFSRNFQDGSKGKDGKLAHFGVSLALSGNFGKPEKEYQYSSPETRWPSGGFYQCVDDKECGAWVSYWTAPTTFTILQLKKADKPGEGYLLLRTFHEKSKS